MTVANVKPSIVVDRVRRTADEGDTNTYSFTVTDPGADTHTITTACGANGAKVPVSDTYNAGTGLGSFECFFPDGPATTNVTATVTDSDGATDTDNQVVVVTVTNVAPTVTLSAGNDLSVNEGTSHTYSFTTTDPGEDDFALAVDRLRRQRHPGRRGHVQHHHGCGQFRVLVPRRRRPRARVGAGRGLRRRRQQHRHPDRDGRQRRPDGHLDR